MNEETRRFLDNFHGGVEGLLLLVWTLQNKTSHYFPDAASAAAAVSSFGGPSGMDCYVSVSLAAEQYGPKVRLSSKPGDGRLPAAIPGMWSDVDVAGPAHKKANLPPTREDALTLVDASGRKPTAVVWSGHGLQPWWLLKEPWVFDTDDERKRAAALAESWGKHLQRKAAAKGWTIDSVHDLTRVMRVPGTWNHKQEVVEAKILYADWDLRYDPSDFEGFDSDPNTSRVLHVQVPRTTYKCGDLIFSPDAKYPAATYVLLYNSPEFRKVFEHARKDLPSCSEYEMSLTNYAVQALWSDQEIVDLLIAHRRQWVTGKSATKLIDRPELLKNIIAKVRGDQGRDRAIRELVGVLDDPEPTSSSTSAPESGPEGNGTPPPPPDPRQKDLDLLSNVFGIRIKRMIQFGMDNRALYSLELVNGQQILLGTVKAIMYTPNAFMEAVYVQTRVSCPPIPKKAWPSVRDALGRVCDVIEATDASAVFAAKHNVGAYLHSQGVYTQDQIDLACSEGAPFVLDGLLLIFVDSFRKWMSMHGTEKWDRNIMFDLLRSIGFSQHTVPCQVDGRRTSKSYWSASRELFADAITFVEEPAE